MTPQNLVLVLVDDDPLVRQMVGRFGAGAGYDVVSSAGGVQLLDQLQRQPALALVDLQMPGVQGLHVLRAVRERVPACEIVLTSSEATIKQAVEALRLGALDYLSKPLDFDRLGRLLVVVREEAARRRSLLAISTDAERTLFNAHWEGHLRELRNRAEPASLLAEGLLTPEWGRVGAATTPAPATETVPVIAREPQGQDRDELGLKRVERDHIVRVLERSRGNKKAAAELLGISRRKLYRYLEEYHLHIPHKAKQHTDSALL
jgi:DNA-binding NtrC family response regulator